MLETSEVTSCPEQCPKASIPLSPLQRQNTETKRGEIGCLEVNQGTGDRAGLLGFGLGVFTMQQVPLTCWGLFTFLGLLYLSKYGAR